MKNFVCWDRQEIRNLENLDADALGDAFFQAVHTDIAVRLERGLGANATQVAATPTQLTEEILRQRTHAIVPIIGPAGSGKSHLVRWLSIRLKARVPDAEVIYVPKAQTNLREILILLVGRLPKDEQRPYLDALREVGAGLVQKRAQPVSVLMNLRLALTNDVPGKDPQLDIETEQHCIEGLRALLGDSHLESAFVREGGFADTIASHIFDPPDRAHYQQATERREFKSDDLPVRAGDLKKAALAAQNFIADLIAMPDLQPVCVKIINRNLDWVISTCLNLSSDRLIQLMSSVRSHFVKSGREQIFLFIEDFARLQGVDRALMQSIIQPKPGILRTIFACTEGFYNDLRDTVIDRIEFVVRPGVASTTSTDDIASFVANYMNGVRWGVRRLEEQFREQRQQQQGFSVANNCEDCQYREECHEAFGNASGVGLYPFNKKAIDVMAKRSGSFTEKGFNPRDFLRKALRPVLEQGAEITSGVFPTDKLYEHLGASEISRVTEEKLQKIDPQAWRRRRTLIEFWYGADAIVNLPKSLQAAFDLRLVSGIETGTPELESDKKNRKGIEELGTPGGTGTPTSLPRGQEALQQTLIEIEKWARNETISAATVNKLRPLIFGALQEYIAWDDLGLSQKLYFDKQAVFSQAQITFPRAATTPSPNPFQLLIEPIGDADAGYTRLVLALQGLLEADTAGNWDFSDGARKFSAFLECLEIWSQDLVARFQAIERGNGDVSDAQDAFHLLALRQLAFHDYRGPLTEESVLCIALAELDGRPADFAAPALNSLMNEQLSPNKARELRDIVRTRFSLTKGAQSGRFFDATRVWVQLQTLASGNLCTPERWAAEAVDKKNALGRLPREVSKAWLNALEAERKQRVEFLNRLQLEFGSESTAADVASLVSDVVNGASQLEVKGARDLDSSWTSVKDRWDPVRQVVIDTTDAEEMLGIISHQIGRDLRACTAFLGALVEMVGRLEVAVKPLLEKAGIDPAEKDQLTEDLRESLHGIAEGLQELGSYESK